MKMEVAIHIVMNLYFFTDFWKVFIVAFRNIIMSRCLRHIGSFFYPAYICFVFCHISRGSNGTTKLMIPLFVISISSMTAFTMNSFIPNSPFLGVSGFAFSIQICDFWKLIWQFHFFICEKIFFEEKSYLKWEENKEVAAFREHFKGNSR